MQQTLLCLLGVIVLGLYGLSRHESYAHKESIQFEREIETATLEIYQRWSNHLNALAFDEERTDMVNVSAAGDLELMGMTDAAVGLSANLGADSGESSPSDFDDVDDFDGYVGTHTYPIRGIDVPFEVRVDVDYVDPWDYSRVRNSPTSAKRATVSVYHVLQRADGVPADTVGLSEMITMTADGAAL